MVQGASAAAPSQPQKRLGILLTAGAAHPHLLQSLKLADAALQAGVDVYFYCLDDAVTTLDHPLWAELQARGLKLFACAYAAQRRGVPAKPSVVFSGLPALGGLIAHTDRFVSFNSR